MLNRSIERIVVGAGLAIGATVLLPIAKTTLSGVLSSARTGMKMVREELEDIVAEAEYERMKRKMDEEILE